MNTLRAAPVTGRRGAALTILAAVYQSRPEDVSSASRLRDCVLDAFADPAEHAEAPDWLDLIARGERRVGPTGIPSIR
jgi:hypothetical protein